jgi:light-regulated signal transduction histidine kinase (bacteriophytochrome)
MGKVVKNNPYRLILLFIALSGALTDAQGNTMADLNPFYNAHNVEELQQLVISNNGSFLPISTFVSQMERFDTILIAVASILLVALGIAVSMIAVLRRKQRMADEEFKNKAAQLADCKNQFAALHEEVANAKEAVTKMNDEMNAFSYSIAHDLKAPLRVISGFSTILMEEYAEKADPTAKKLIETIHQNTRRMEELINDLLELSRLGSVALNKQQFDMRQLVDLALKERTPDILSNIQILPMATSFGDPALLRQVWENYISNAIKFSSRKDSPQIEIGYKPVGSEQQFWVKDNGVGFDPGYKDKLFKVFSRLHSRKEFDGTGAGLAISKKIIEAHGGRVWAEGKIADGASFYFAIPAKQNGVKNEI